jgi:hypothetical protein
LVYALFCHAKLVTGSALLDEQRPDVTSGRKPEARLADHPPFRADSKMVTVRRNGAGRTANGGDAEPSRIKWTLAVHRTTAEAFQPRRDPEQMK